MDWLEITVPAPGSVAMRWLDSRFHELATRLLDYDFDVAGTYGGSQLDTALQLVTEIAEGTRNQHHAVLPTTAGQSVIIAADEAADLLPQLRQAINIAISST